MRITQTLVLYILLLLGRHLHIHVFMCEICIICAGRHAHLALLLAQLVYLSLNLTSKDYLVIFFLSCYSNLACFSVSCLGHLPANNETGFHSWLHFCLLILMPLHLYCSWSWLELLTTLLYSYLILPLLVSYHHGLCLYSCLLIQQLLLPSLDLSLCSNLAPAVPYYNQLLGDQHTSVLLQNSRCLGLLELVPLHCPYTSCLVFHKCHPCQLSLHQTWNTTGCKAKECKVRWRADRAKSLAHYLGAR